MPVSPLTPQPHDVPAVLGVALSLVVPLYNEEANFEELTSRLTNTINSHPTTCEVVLVDDGSTDETGFLIAQLCQRDPRFTGVFLSRNHGHQLAVSAGLVYASGSEAIFILDGDLQDPPELLPAFYSVFIQGYDVVYGIRIRRKEPWLKKAAYWLFYRLLNTMAGRNIPLDSGDFALLSRRVVELLNSMPEQSRYLRGMRSWVGFRQTGIVYEREARAAGHTKFTWRKLFQLAYDGIFNFSEVPVKLITGLGLFTVLLSLVYLTGMVLYHFYVEKAPRGFITIIFAISLFSGVQLISLGILGEYVLRIYRQVLNRPLFVVARTIRKGVDSAA
jgi:dolichol-phosphate mannosyltransferase